jgi:ribose transport system ATP-binding protein
MTAPLLEIRNVTKSFPGVRAVDDVSFTLSKGEILALVGENGAGKSTLLGILGGSLVPDSGSVFVESVRRTEYTPRRALADGVVVAYQEPAIVPQLTVEQNLLIGRSVAQRRASTAEVQEALADLARMGFPLNASARVSTLSPGQRQALTIARAFAFGAKIVALDEPTTSLLENNVTAVLTRVRELSHEKGVGIIYVSHKMHEVMEVSDFVLVLRDGKIQFSNSTSATSMEEIVRNMVGRQLLEFRRTHPVAPDAPVLFTATDVTHPSGVGPASISVRAGEVLGIAGLVGSGRTEFLRAIVKADAGSTGSVAIDGRRVPIHGPRDSRDAGIAFIPEERKRQGLVLQMPAYANVTLTAGREFVRFGPFLNPSLQIAATEQVGARLSLRPANARLAARQFSGGNQQKLVIAKWIRREARVYLFDEPTKGVDVAGKAEIYALIDALAASGHAIVVVSSDLPEIIALSDRALVMRNGRFISEHVGDDINEHSLVASAMGIMRGTT